MNPSKCAFGVSLGKFLGFIVYQRGIDLDPMKAKAIAALTPPTTLKELLVLYIANTEQSQGGSIGLGTRRRGEASILH